MSTLSLVHGHVNARSSRHVTLSLVTHEGVDLDRYAMSTISLAGEQRVEQLDRLGEALQPDFADQLEA